MKYEIVLSKLAVKSQ